MSDLEQKPEQPLEQKPEQGNNQPKSKPSLNPTKKKYRDMIKEVRSIYRDKANEEVNLLKAELKHTLKSERLDRKTRKTVLKKGLISFLNKSSFKDPIADWVMVRMNIKTGLFETIDESKKTN